MKIAVASNGLDVSSYFESCTNYNCYTIENGGIISCRNFPVLRSQNSVVAETLYDLGVDIILVGCISEANKRRLESSGWTVLPGVCGNAKQSVEAYLTDTFIACDESCDEA